MNSRLLLILAIGVAGCSDLPDVGSGSCGNHVVEAGEDCDSGAAGCGAPGTPAACRFTCAGGASCPSGQRCGTDQVCRRATGTFTFAAPFGQPGDQFRVVDVDGDGALDVIDRAPRQLTVWRNDGLGHFAANARGAAPGLADFPGVAVGRTTGEEPLVAAMTPSAVDLFKVTTDGQVQPIVFPASAIPNDAQGKPETFIGGVIFAEGTPASPLFWDHAGKQLVVYQASFGAVASPVASIDLTACGGAGDRFDPRVTLANPPTAMTTQPKAELNRAPTVIGIISGPTSLCVATANADMTFTVVNLPLPSTDAILYTQDTEPWIAIGDFDKDGRWDVMTSTFAQSVEAGVEAPTVWLQDPAAMSLAFLPPTVNIDGCYFFNYGATTATADYNLDGYDDVATGQNISLNDLWKSGDGWETQNTIDLGLTVNHTYTILDAAGDVNRDGVPDLVFATKDQGDVAVCLNDGDGIRLTCDPVSTGIDGIYGLAIADINGDHTPDIVVSSGSAANDSTGTGTPDGGTGTPDGGTGAMAATPSEIDVILGRAFGLPDPQTIPVTAYHSELLGIARSPSASLIADDIIAALRNDDGSVGTVLGHATEAGVLTFGLPVPSPTDVRLADATGDGIPDLLLLTSGNGSDVTSYVFPGSRSSGFSGGVGKTLDGAHGLRFVDGIPDESLPSVLWVSTAPGGMESTVPQQLLLDRLRGSTWMETAVDLPLDAQKPWEYHAPYNDGVLADLDGDGRNEIILYGSRWSDQSGEVFDGLVLVGKFPAGGGAPTFTQVAIKDHWLFHDPFFADVAPVDGLLDMFVTVEDDAGQAHVKVLRQHTDGSFDDEGSAPDAPAGFSSDQHFLATTDVNGDAIPDIVLYDSKGVVVVTANTERP